MQLMFVHYCLCLPFVFYRACVFWVGHCLSEREMRHGLTGVGKELKHIKCASSSK